MQTEITNTQGSSLTGDNQKDKHTNGGLSRDSTEVASGTPAARQDLAPVQEPLAPMPSTEGIPSLQDEWASAPVQAAQNVERKAAEVGSKLVHQVDEWLDKKGVKTQARDTWHTVSSNLRERADQVDRDIKKKPYAYVLGALGAGVIIARMIM